MGCKTILLRAASATLFVLAGIGAAHAASQPAAPLWHKTCDEAAPGHPCWVEQFAVVMPKKIVVAHLRLDLQQGDKTGIIVFAPMGVALMPGLQLVLDGGKPITLPYERCSAEGCEASAVLDHAAVEKFERGKTLTVRYVVAGQQTANIPIQLKGLAAALKSLAN